MLISIGLMTTKRVELFTSFLDCRFLLLKSHLVVLPKEEGHTLLGQGTGARQQALGFLGADLNARRMLLYLASYL